MRLKIILSSIVVLIGLIISYVGATHSLFPAMPFVGFVITALSTILLVAFIDENEHRNDK